MLRRLAKRKPVFQVFPSADWESAGPSKGNLSGRMRAKCGDYYFGLAGRSVALGFAAVNTTGDPVPPVQLQQVAVKPAYTKAVADLIARVAKVKVAPTIERAFVDLGNGKPEIIFQATHPDLDGDPPDYKPEYYSLIVVLPDAAGVEPAFTGYLQAAKDWAFFEVLTLDSVADVDLGRQARVAGAGAARRGLADAGLPLRRETGGAVSIGGRRRRVSGSGRMMERPRGVL